MTLKTAIERHINSAGSGFELDDVMSNGCYPRELTDRIYEISQKYRTADYPIGVDNPKCFSELKKLVDEFG